MNTPSTIELGDLLPGDILFYRTTNDAGAGLPGLTSQDIADDFPTLAAFAQGLPYHVRDGIYQPWFHVVVYAGDGEIIGFDDLSYGSDYAETPKLAKVALELEELQLRNVALDVRRPPAASAQCIVDTSLAMVNASTDYALEGLLAFALATLGWMLPKGPLRAKALLEARGANFYALTACGQQKRTCVTAVAKAIEVATKQKLLFEEPPALPRCYVDSSGVADEINATIDKLRSRVASGQLASLFQFSHLDVERMNALAALTYDPLQGDTATEVLSTLDRRFGLDLLGSEAFPDGLAEALPDYFREFLPEGHPLFEAGDVRIPGGGVITDPVTAIALLEKGIETLNLPTGTDLEAKGQTLPGPLSSDDLIVSPAMLWDALNLECFEKCGELTLGP